MKQFRYILEAVLVWIAFAVFKIMGPDAASSAGGWLGRTVGPRLGASRKARNNLKNAFPDMTDAEYDKTIHDMWDNLGRVFAEYPHLHDIIYNKIEIVGMENLNKIGARSSFLAMGSHLANWELFPFFMNYPANADSSCIYRIPNNPYVAWLLDRCRNPEEKAKYIPKSMAGTKDMVKTLQAGGRISILIDQKYNQGEAIEFFGRPAMTSTSIAQLSLKFGIPILPIQIERLSGCRFRATVHPPLDTNGLDEKAIMLSAHHLLEDWIAKRPSQWLWLHRRWDSKALQ